MRRTIIAVIAGMLAWLALAKSVKLAMRAFWPNDVTAEPRFAFTLPMQLARLAIGAATTICAGWLAAWIARGDRPATVRLGVVLLLFFIPNHYYPKDAFPLWYHLAFLLSLLPLAVVGGVIGGRAACS